MDQQALIQRQQWFVNQRFGMFIHFNSATFQFADSDIIDWEYDHENGDEPRRFPFDPKDWNPEQLDCSQWAKAAKSAGMSFAALTAKHHEGFSLWPTEHTEHCVRNAASQRDVVKEYLDAFRAEGIEAGLYFSMLDLHHQIGRRKCTPADKQFIKNQLEELLTNYGELPFLIIDGWNAHWGGPSYENLPFEEIDAWVKQLQPQCLLMNISCETNLNHTDVVFYENAAGQEVEDGFVGPGASCNVLTKTWFWRTTDTTRELKTVDWALDMIQDCNRQNVTFLLNGAPNRQGLLDANVLERFREIGQRYRKPEDLTVIPEGWLTRG
ncbi:alpha-L-fucosidase [Paenibacillus rhizosphaerae]|uniref:alpha-L-fucosidase n=1 Tax=Paenibacillus rhizosphaerae TaxID=297318 RepID=A0A1R1ELR4_9BACL|nr:MULTISPECIES: alpha-L-fucosidase [Paenibacillus]OMF52745.1 alpha-L-fucosidase [Paenibacillus rhizosphaerae]UYO06189.1 alpha-L-fucosidase [Paenibacillus sp. PSB04]